MKRIVSSAFALAFLTSLGQTVYADTTHTGHVRNLYADPSDVVIESDVYGSCGSNLFHIQRNNANFMEMTAITLMAFSKGKSMWLVVSFCAGDRNILSHAAIFG